jgi:hypothetical protein
MICSYRYTRSGYWTGYVIRSRLFALLADHVRDACLGGIELGRYDTLASKCKIELCPAGQRFASRQPERRSTSVSSAGTSNCFCYSFCPDDIIKARKICYSRKDATGKIVTRSTKSDLLRVARGKLVQKFGTIKMLILFPATFRVRGPPYRTAKRSGAVVTSIRYAGCSNAGDLETRRTLTVTWVFRA